MILSVVPLGIETAVGERRGAARRVDGFGGRAASAAAGRRRSSSFSRRAVGRGDAGAVSTLAVAPAQAVAVAEAPSSPPSGRCAWIGGGR